MDYQTALAMVRSLTTEEQARLVGEVWDQLDEEDVFVPTRALAAELDRRLDELDRNPQKGRPWKEVIEEMRGNLGLESADLGDELRAELTRRSEEFDRNPNSGIPWEAVEARLRAKYQL